MIKEIFDIEPKQKNVLIILIGIFGLSFLQLYLFKKSIFDLGIFFSLGVSLGLTVCWSMLNIPSLVLFWSLIKDDPVDKKVDRTDYQFVIFILGLLALAWISALTFISYELNFDFKYFLRLSIGVSILRILTWTIVLFIEYRNSKKATK
jgi:hypothetical protein